MSRFFMTCGKATRRAPYQRRLVYLESTGTQYIDTGIVATATAGVDITAMATGTGSNGFFFAGGGTEGGDEFSCYTWNRIEYHRFGRSVPTPNIVLTLKAVYRIVAIGNDITVTKDGAADYSGTIDAATATPGNDPVYLFALNRGTISPGTCRIYSCKFYDGNTVVGDFIPVMDWNDVPCMYDNVSKALFHNIGTGTFNCA